MKSMIYKPEGVCTQEMDIHLDGTKIKSVDFYGGCNGNTQGIGRLIEGMEIDEVIERLDGIKCGFRNTSCPDQLAKALKAIKNGDLK